MFMQIIKYEKHPIFKLHCFNLGIFAHYAYQFIMFFLLREDLLFWNKIKKFSLVV